MNRKKYGIVILLLSLLTLAGCNSWLDVNPKNQVTDNKLFSDYSGFRNALNGIYGELSGQDLYGRELTWGFVSVLAQTYDATKLNNAYKELSTYNYELKDNRDVIDNLWIKMYNAIANCNKLIDEIQNKEGSFFPLGLEEKNLIEGEAYALRAFIHLDLLRLFAPAPIVDKGEAHLPYFMTYPSKYEAPRKTADYLEFVIADLLKAKDLVTGFDTVYAAKTGLYSYNFRFQVNEASGLGRFFSARGMRMNYMVVHGLLARAYMYAGNEAKAAEEARYVLTNFVQKEGGIDAFVFTSADKLGKVKANFYTKYRDDILFAFYDDQLTDEYEKYMTEKGTKLVLKGWDNMFSGRQDGNDYRKNQGELDQETGLTSTMKWMNLKGTDAMITMNYPLIPVLRLSEMYYILSECMYKAENMTDAKTFLQRVREGRNALRAVDMEHYTDELIWDAKKEFLTEGQIFFLFKRLNEDVVTGVDQFKLGDKFVLPKPEKENVF